MVDIKGPLTAQQIKRRRLNLIKAIIINLISLTLLVGLSISFFTNKTPWLLGRPSPSVVTETRLNERWTNEVFLPSGLGKIDDSGNIVAWLHTQTSGTVMNIKTNGEKKDSASIILKDYSLFVHADSDRQIWLHRGQKVLQAYGENSEVLWEHHFDSWPDNAWSDEEGYILTSQAGAGEDKLLTLFSNEGEILWQYLLKDMQVAEAVLAPLGQGALIIARLNNTNSDYNFLLLGPGGVAYDNLTLNSVSNKAAAIFADGQGAYIAADRELYYLENPEKKGLTISSFQTPLNPDTEEEEADLRLPAPVSQIRVIEKDREAVLSCWDEVNKTGWLVYISQNKQIVWSEALSEKLLTLRVHPGGLAIYGGSANVLFTYTNQGDVIWLHHMIEANLTSIVFSPSGRYLAALNRDQKLTMWQVP